MSIFKQLNSLDEQNGCIKLLKIQIQEFQFVVNEYKNLENKK